MFCSTWNRRRGKYSAAGSHKKSNFCIPMEHVIFRLLLRSCGVDCVGVGRFNLLPLRWHQYICGPLCHTREIVICFEDPDIKKDGAIWDTAQRSTLCQTAYTAWPLKEPNAIFCSQFMPIKQYYDLPWTESGSESWVAFDPSQNGVEIVRNISEVVFDITLF